MDIQESAEEKMDLGSMEQTHVSQKYIDWDEGELNMSLAKEIVTTLGDLSDKMATRADIEKLRGDVCDLKAEKSVLEAKAETVDVHLAQQDEVIGELEKRLTSIEQWRWKIVGGMLVLATVGSSIGSAFTSFLLAK